MLRRIDTIKYRQHIGGDMAGENDSLTYDELSEVYRMEKSKSTLYSIRKDFYQAAQVLIADITKECDRLAMENPDSFMYEGLSQKKRNLLSSLKKIVEIRMGKIAGMAMRGAMGANNVLDDLTPEEKEYYNRVLESSKEFWKLSERKRKTIIKQDITEIVQPAPVKEEPKPVAEEKAKEINDIPLSEIPVDDSPEEMPVQAEEMVDDDIEESVPEPAPESVTGPAEVSAEETAPVEEEPVQEHVPAVEEPKPVPEISEEGNVTIRILEDLPPFSGIDVDYDLKKEDVVRMPAVLAKALISRGVARLISTA